MNTLEINNDNLQSFFLTTEQIKQADEMRKKEEVEKYWMRIEHVMLDVLADIPRGEDESNDE